MSSDINPQMCWVNNNWVSEFGKSLWCILIVLSKFNNFPLTCLPEFDRYVPHFLSILVPEK